MMWTSRCFVITGGSALPQAEAAPAATLAALAAFSIDGP